MKTAASQMPVRSNKLCVVYDPESGRMHHLHRVVTFEGGSEPSPEQIAADALKAFHGLHAGRHGKFETLHVDHDAIEPGKKYRVDVQTKRLVT